MKFSKIGISVLSFSLLVVGWTSKEAPQLKGKQLEVTEEKSEPATGFVHYKTTRSSGWNNQREGAMMAWMVAYFTGHTLELKPFHPANTGVLPDQGGYKHGDLWNLSCLEKHVQVRNIPSNKTSEGYDYNVSRSSVFANYSEVQALKKYNKITYNGGWACIIRAFPWLNPSQEVFSHLMNSFSYNFDIQRSADLVLERIGRPYVGLHIRKDRFPATNCSALGLNVSSAEESKFNLRRCKGLNWTNVVDRMFPNLDDDYPIYIAHDSSSRMDPTLLGRNFLQSFDFDFVRQLRPAILSAVEQEVMIRAEYFIPSMYSTWSEYAVFKRAVAGKADGMQNYQHWKAEICH